MKFDLGRQRLTSAEGSGITTTRAPRPEDIQALGAEVFRQLMLYGNVVARRTEQGEIEIVDPMEITVPLPGAQTLSSISTDQFILALVEWGMADNDIASILAHIDKETQS